VLRASAIPADEELQRHAAENLMRLINWGWIPGVILLSLLHTDARAESVGGKELFEEPVGSFVFDASLGNPAPPLTIWYYRPDTVRPGTRVVFLMHGDSRSGQVARDWGARYGKKHDFIVIAPEFSEKEYPGDTYTFGNMLGPDGKLLPESMWASATIERVFDKICEQLQLSAESYDILGHSGGGQIVHRLVLFAPHLHFRRAVAVSPGRYAFPRMSETFPYGLKGAPLESSALARAFSRDFVLVLGDRDTDDRARESEAMAQGSNRFARGLRFFAAATEQANALKVPLAWRLRIAHGLDHSPAPAVEAGFEQLLSSQGDSHVQGYVLGPREGQVAMSHTIKADPVLGSDRLGSGTQILKASSGIEFHSHEIDDEILYVVRGRGIGAVGSTRAQLIPGSVLYAPSGAWHAIRAEEEMEILWISSPPHFANYLRDLESAKQEGQLTDERWGTIAENHHFRDGRGFLKEFLGGTAWRGDVEPWTVLRFEETGVIAFGGADQRIAVEFFDPSEDALGFIGRWRSRHNAVPEHLVIHYDPSAPQALQVTWGEKLEHSSMLRRE
jgi:quercetin dioxygenase-like cupin family protein/poly(3-hydroxybutyrate) depolymerase